MGDQGPTPAGGPASAYQAGSAARLHERARPDHLIEAIIPSSFVILMTFLLFDSLFDINTKTTLDCLNEELVKLFCELILTHITLHPIYPHVYPF